MRRSLRYIFAALLSFPALLPATPINLGVFSFDNLIPDGASPGVNVFDISLFTGATWSLPPDFPDLNESSLLGAVLTLDGSDGTEQIDLGDISPGLFTPPPSIEFPTTTTFTDATLTGTLDNVVLQLSDGTTFTAASASIVATILPSSGLNLVAGTDLAIVVTADEAVSAPEPGSLELLSGAVLAVIVARKLAKTRRN